MNGENAVATPKAAESVNSLSIAGRDEIFLATKIVLRFVTLVVTPARWLVYPSIGMTMSQILKQFFFVVIKFAMLKLFTFAAVVGAATAFSPCMVNHFVFF